jgi:hypothetical protein
VIFLERSSLIEDNLQGFEGILDFARFKFNDIYGHTEFTKAYSTYNVFTLTATDSLMYSLFKELQLRVRSVLGDQPLWMQCWMNYHTQQDVLDWHDHDWQWHGYITIDPKKTNTVFEDFTVENKPGQIYFGEGHKKHKVEVLEPYEGHRITLGYDITNKSGERSKYVSFIPF